MYYKIRYGISGMEKFITDKQYEDLCINDQSYYEKVIINQCAAHERDSISNLEIESVVKQEFYD